MWRSPRWLPVGLRVLGSAVTAGSRVRGIGLTILVALALFFPIDQYLKHPLGVLGVRLFAVVAAVLALVHAVGKRVIAIEDDAQRRVLEIEKRLAILETARTPKLAIEFDRDDPSCVMRIRNVEPYAMLYRVRVTNTTDATISGVRIELTELEPAFISYLPAPLLIMHENDQVREITLNPHQPRHVDVVQRADIGGPIVLWHTVAGQGREFNPLGNFVLTITAWAHNTAPSSQRFCALLDRRGAMDFDYYRGQRIHWTL